MNNDIKVEIVLASYNGGLYIKEQIISILEQTHKNIRLIISDDGSSDNTHAIVQEIQKNDERVEFYRSCNSPGVINNFNYGLSKTDADYIMFSDQDDVWVKDKVESLLIEIRKAELEKENIIPCLIFSNLCVVDEKLNVLGDDFYNLNKLDPLNNLDSRYLIWRSTVYGCTTIFNRALLLKAGLTPGSITMHDHWFAFNALKFGKLIFNNNKFVLYRQHSNNIVGSHKRDLYSKIKRLRKTILGINKNIDAVRYLEKINVKNPRKFSLIKNVLPFYSERISYALLFCLLWSIK